MPDLALDRRALLRLLGGGAVGLLVAACSGPLVPTISRSNNAATGTAKLPTYIPVPVNPPDLPGTDQGVAPGYLSFPKLIKSVQEPPGKGGDVTVLTYTANTTPPPLEQNPAWQEINRRLNVNLKAPTIAQVDYPTRLATAMASGDLPDLLLVSPQGSVIQNQDQFLASACADLTPYLSGDSIKDYPNLANLPTYGWKSSIFNGRIYGVPSIAFYEGIAMYSQQRALERAGVGEVNTAADFLNAAKSMLVPGQQWVINGNTSPLGSILYYFLGVFRAPNNWKESGGKLTKDWETDEYKTAVEYVRSLWDAGVVHPNTPTMTGSQSAESWYSGQSVFWGQLMANFTQSYDKALLGTPDFKPRILPRFSHDGKDRGIQLLTSGLGGLMALKKASPDRIKELLGVLNFLAAPFGTEEALLLRYGVQGPDFQFDEKGNPVATKQGLADIQIPLKFIAYFPPVIYDPTYPEATQLLHDAEVASMPLGVQSPTLGLYSTSDAAQSSNLNQTMLDGLNAIMFGRADMSTYDQLVSDWRSHGGDQIGPSTSTVFSNPANVSDRRIGMRTQPIKFGIVGLDHNHVYNHVQILLNAGAELAAVYSDKPERLAQFAERYPGVEIAPTMEALLEDTTIGVVAGSAMPAERANVSIKAMQHGKDVLSDKPAVVNLEQLDEIERVQRATGRIWCLYVNEHYDRRCTLKAGELVADGAIGRVVQTTGLGPHKIAQQARPAWFYDRSISGGIIGDVGAHQIEQFLYFTGSTTAKIVHAQTGNFAHPEHPEFEDYGDVLLQGDSATGWFRVDWHTPSTMPVPGDIRLFLLGTDGYMEMRKYYDPAGRPGGEHLILVNNKGTELIDTSSVPLTFASKFLDDVRHRTQTAMRQELSFMVTRLATQAQLSAERLTTPAVAARV